MSTKLFEHRGKPDPAKVREREEAHKRGLARSKHAREVEREEAAAKRQRDAERRKRELELKLQQTKKQQQQSKQQRNQQASSQKQVQTKQQQTKQQQSKQQQSKQQQSKQQQQKQQQQSKQQQSKQQQSKQQQQSAIQRQQNEIEVKKKADKALRTVHSNNEQVAQNIIELEQKGPSKAAQEVGKQASGEVKEFKQKMDDYISQTANSDQEQIDVEKSKKKTKEVVKRIQDKYSKDPKLSKSDMSWLSKTLKKTEKSLLAVIGGVGSLMGFTDVYNSGKEALSSIFSSKH